MRGMIRCQSLATPFIHFSAKVEFAPEDSTKKVCSISSGTSPQKDGSIFRSL